jgi:hypothetical protein
MADPRTLFVAGLAPALLAALVFARAAVFKLRDLPAFADAVEAYDILPALLGRPLARALPAVEMALAAALLAPWTRQVGEIAAAGLLVLFATAMGINLARGRRHIDCGCGDPAKRQALSWMLVGRNLVLAVLLLAAAASPAGQGSVPAVAIALTAALAAFLLLLCQEAFLALPDRRARTVPFAGAGGGHA